MKQVFIVEDDDDLRQLLELALQKTGVEIRTYSTAKEALADDVVGDVYLADINLPGTSGIELCNLLKSNAKTKHSKVILISANADIEKLSSEACADDFLRKPFSVSEVWDKISMALKDE